MHQLVQDLRFINIICIFISKSRKIRFPNTDRKCHMLISSQSGSLYFSKTPIKSSFIVYMQKGCHTRDSLLDCFIS